MDTFIRSVVRLIFGMFVLAAGWFLLHWMASNWLLAAAGSSSLVILYILIVSQQTKNT